VSPLPEQFANAEGGAARDEQEAARRREGPDVRGSAVSSGDDVAGSDATSARESAIDHAVEMTFPASDPPAWMPSGMRRPDADAADRAEGDA